MTYLITIDDFKRKADLSANIHTDKIKAQIGPTQEMFVLKILCQELYDELIEEFAASDLSEANTDLLPYVKDFLIYKTYSRYTVTANVSSTAAGFVSHKDDISEIANPDQMKAIRMQAESDANFYQDRLVNFLKKNEDTYTLWRDSQCNCNPSIRPLGLNRISKVGTSRQYTPIKWT